MKTKTFIEIENREELWTILTCLRERELAIQKSIDFFNEGNAKDQTEENEKVINQLIEELHEDLRRVHNMAKRVEEAY